MCKYQQLFFNYFVIITNNMKIIEININGIKIEDIKDQNLA